MKVLSKFILGVLVAASSLFTACDDLNSEPQMQTFAVFATLSATGNNGCTFVTQKHESDEPIIFTSTIALDSKEFPTGTRYYVQYTNDSQEMYHSGAITLLGCFKVTNADAEPHAKSVIDNNMKDAINVEYLSRTGNYVNAYATASMKNAAKTFNVYFDENTIDNEYPDAYLVFTSDGPMASQKVLLGSFDISKVWARTSCKGLKFHYLTRAGVAEATFKKDSSTTIRPIE